VTELIKVISESGGNVWNKTALNSKQLKASQRIKINKQTNREQQKEIFLASSQHRCADGRFNYGPMAFKSGRDRRWFNYNLMTECY
jgi:hypothetical protein